MPQDSRRFEARGDRSADAPRRLLFVPCPVCMFVPTAVILLITGPAAARDRVVIQAPDRSTPLAISGDVSDYTAERIEIHLTVGNPVHEFPTAQVRSVETVQTEAHRAGVKAFRAGNLDAARTEFEQALKDEPRSWVRREILGWLVRVAMRSGDRTQAATCFLQILSDEAAPREYALAPLVWEPLAISSSLHQHGRLWLTGATSAQRLMGGSILLLDQRYGETARAELDRLARDKDLRIAALARAQLWRLRVSAADITDNELAGWEQTISQLPPELRAGPTFLLGRAALQRSEYDRAAATLMWLPTVYHENESLTAQAAMGAATALERIGRPNEARELLAEIINDYGWSPAAADAKSLLTRLGPAPAS